MHRSFLAVAALLPSVALAQPSQTPPAEPTPAPEPTSAPAPVPAPIPATEPSTDYRRPVAPGKDIVIRTEGERSRNNLITVGSLAGGGALISAVGLYFHLDSKSNSDAVGAQTPQNVPWSAARQAQYDQAHSSATKAEVFYGIGGAALVASVVYLIVTAPQTETTVIHPHTANAVPTLAPTAGGAVLGGAWRF